MNNKELSERKIIAWGKSKLLEFYVKDNPNHRISYVIDSNTATHGMKFNGLTIKSPQSLREEEGEVTVVIFAVSTTAVQSILIDLNNMGLRLGRDVLLYADLFYDKFAEKVKKTLGRDIDPSHYQFVKSFSLNTLIPVHTTLLGNILFLTLLEEMLKNKNEKLALAEVGAFNGGNVILSSQFMALNAERRFHVFDSFDGFPELSKYDPKDQKAGNYTIQTSLERILDNLSMFPFVHVHKGFVPATFSELDKQEQYGLVFYDCDLYEPALATFEYFWDRLVPGGFMLIHDYIAEEGGFHGVKKASDEFFLSKHVPIHEFWENTMGLVIKPS